MNISKIRWMVLSLLFFKSMILTAQFDVRRSYLNPSPNAISAIQQLSAPVNFYHGTPSVGADLHVLEGVKGFSIPIRLSYKASGIKVQDVASSVGLGWSISTTSLITRVVQGLKDEDIERGYFGTNMGSKINGKMGTDTLNKIIKNELDSEPDLFLYNINGLAGSFVFDKNKKPVLLTDNGIQILNTPFKKELGADGWILGDLQGNRYFLGDISNSTETSKSIVYTDEGPEEQTFISSWFLTSISTQNNLQLVKYNYETADEISTTYYRNKYRYRNKVKTEYKEPIYFLGIRFREASVESSVQIVDQKLWSNNSEIKISAPVYLSSISTSNQKAYFYYSGGRKDIPNGKALSKIEIQNSNGAKLKEFQLDYDYFLANDKDRLDDLTREALYDLSRAFGAAQSQNLQVMYFYQQKINDLKLLWSQLPNISDNDYENRFNELIAFLHGQRAPVLDSKEEFRLKLNNVNVLVTNNTTSDSLYRFEYNALALPPRNSLFVDHWGYYNKKSNDKTFGDFPESDEEFIGNKVTDKDRVLACQLRKIVNQLGGYKEFSFSANEYYNSVSNKNEYVGGLRVEKIVDVGGNDNPPIISKYIYKDNSGKSTGKLLRPLPAYYHHVAYKEGNYFANDPLSKIPWSNYYQEIGSSSGNYVSELSAFKPVGAAEIDYRSAIMGMVWDPLSKAFSSTVSYNYTPFVILSTSGLTEVVDLDGASVGYSEVTILNNGVGKTVNRYTDINDYNDISRQWRIKNDFSIDKTQVIGPTNSPFTPSTSYSFARGLLKESLVFDKDLKLIRKTVNEYIFNSKKDSVLGFRCAIGRVDISNGYANGVLQVNKLDNYFNIGYYYYVAKSILLTKSIEYNYISGEYSPLSFKTEFKYNPAFPSLIIEQKTNNSDGSILTNQFRYVVDKENIEYSHDYQKKAVDSLYSRQAFGLVLQSLSKKDDIVTAATKNSFKEFIRNSKRLIMPDIQYQGREGSLKPKVESLDYDAYGNLVAYKRSGGVVNSFKYSSDGLREIAEVQNASPDEIFLEDFEEVADANTGSTAHTGRKYFFGDFELDFVPPNTKNYKLSFWYLQKGKWLFSGLLNYSGPTTISLGDAIDDIVIAPENAVVKSFTYDSVNGIMSSIDSKQNIFKYNYDNKSRVSSITDGSGNILKHIRYNVVSKAVLPVSIFTNETVSRTFSKQCTQGIGSEVTYTIPADKYISYNNQAEVSAKVEAEFSSKGQQFANANGKCRVYAKLVSSNLRWVYDGYYNKRIADYSIKFYANYDCTIPMATSEEMEVTMRRDYVWSNGIDQTDSYPGYEYFTVDAGQTSINIGAWEVDGYKSWYSSFYQNTFEEGFSYTTYLTALPSNLYFPISTY